MLEQEVPSVKIKRINSTWEFACPLSGEHRLPYVLDTVQLQQTYQLLISKVDIL